MLFISSPAPADWQKFARERMLKDLGEGGLTAFRVGSLPTLRRLTVETIARKKVHRHVSRHLGAFTAIRDKVLRVSTIGRTFLDMIQEPDLCGGIYHVLAVWEENAGRNLPLIVGEVDQHGSKIDKVRVGYILEERLGLKHPSLENWVTFAQRGGSRKLYANASYSERFSEMWCLSLNIEEAVEPDQHHSVDQP
jgi:predicted transcriptional regulator of viral defense system